MKNYDGPVRGRRQSTGSLPRGGGGGRGAMMEMIEMMDDQYGRDLFSSLSSPLSLSVGLSQICPLSLWLDPGRDSSAVQPAAGAMCTVDMYLSALRRQTVRLDELAGWMDDLSVMISLVSSSPAPRTYHVPCPTSRVPCSCLSHSPRPCLLG